MSEAHEREEVYRGAFINVRVETLPEPIGGTRRFEIVEHPDAVAIVAVRSDPDMLGGDLQVALVRQRRPAIGTDLWEIPAGIVDRADVAQFELTAARELREETGYEAAVWQRLTRELPSPGFSTEAITIFLATGVHPAPGATPDRSADPTEIESVRWLPLAQALRLCQSGEIEDGKTILGLTLASAILAKHSDSSATGDSAMPRDALNMPYKRPATYRADESGPDETPGGLDSTLKLDNMLLEEFNYASVTAYQALEDRARMFNLYLLLIGVVASGIGAIYQLGKQNGTASNAANTAANNSLQLLVVVLLLAAAFLGLVFFLKVIYLRRAWLESARAMNAIKEFYIKRFGPMVPGLDRAFRWRLDTIPHKRGAVTFLICYTMAFLGSSCLAGAIFIAYEPWLKQSIGGLIPLPINAQPWIVAGAAGILFLLAHIVFWTRTQHGEERRTSRIRPAQGGDVG
jgi:8-oxo-dGTP pyrophosphatase MutT (NUDIX family)